MSKTAAGAQRRRPASWYQKLVTRPHRHLGISLVACLATLFSLVAQPVADVVPAHRAVPPGRRPGRWEPRLRRPAGVLQHQPRQRVPDRGAEAGANGPALRAYPRGAGDRAHDCGSSRCHQVRRELLCPGAALAHAFLSTRPSGGPISAWGRGGGPLPARHTRVRCSGSGTATRCRRAMRLGARPTVTAPRLRRPTVFQPGVSRTVGRWAAMSPTPAPANPPRESAPRRLPERLYVDHQRQALLRVLVAAWPVHDHPRTARRPERRPRKAGARCRGQH